MSSIVTKMKKLKSPKPPTKVAVFRISRRLQGALMGALGGAQPSIGNALGAAGALPGMPGVMPGMAGALSGMPGALPGMPGAPGIPGAQSGLPEAPPAPPPVDLDAVEAAQTTVDAEIENATKLGNKLKEAVDMLSATTQSHARKGVEYTATVVQPPPPPEEQTGIEMAASASPQESLYTAPVIVLLPPEPTPTEKLEFARAMACLGKMNSPEMRAARSAELQEMATIKGQTLEEMEREILKTQEQLTKAKSDRRRVQEELRQVASNAVEGLMQSQADVLFLKHDTQLADEKITILLDKIERLEIKLSRLRKLEEKESNQSSQGEEGEEGAGAEEAAGAEEEEELEGQEKPERKSKSRSFFRRKRKGTPHFSQTENTNVQSQQRTPQQSVQQLKPSQYVSQQQLYGQQQQAQGQNQQQLQGHRQQQLFQGQQQQVQLAEQYVGHQEEIQHQHVLQQQQLLKQYQQQQQQQQQFQQQVQRLQELRQQEEEDQKQKTAQRKARLGRVHGATDSRKRD